MLVGVCQIDLFLPNSGSLKSKRFVLKSIKTRLRNKFNISISEVGENDKWQRATLGIAIVANSRKFIDQVTSQALNFIESQDQVELIDSQLEIF